MKNNKVKVAFVCVHNSCRSQIAEALCSKFANELIDCYSAGTNVKDSINQDAVRLIKQLYDINMEEKQKPKLISMIPKVDILITMGCNVQCPVLPCQERIDWGLEDPSGKSDLEFIKVIKQIEININELKEKIKKEIK